MSFNCVVCVYRISRSYIGIVSYLLDPSVRVLDKLAMRRRASRWRMLVILSGVALLGAGFLQSAMGGGAAKWQGKCPGDRCAEIWEKVG